MLAPAALAENDGRGFYGATDDKVVTNAGFILIVFFPLFVFVMSMLQRRLEKRKEARKAAAEARSATPAGAAAGSAAKRAATPSRR